MAWAAVEVRVPGRNNPLAQTADDTCTLLKTDRRQLTADRPETIFVLDPEAARTTQWLLEDGK
jgi:hypothetical protein